MSLLIRDSTISQGLEGFKLNTLEDVWACREVKSSQFNYRNHQISVKEITPPERLKSIDNN